MNSKPFIQFKGVKKSYDGKTLVIPNLDLTIHRGEFLTLLGASGSGKTTTLMMLAGFEVPTEGTISIDGKQIQDVPAHQRGIGVVFQNYALFPHMTVAQNLAYPLRMRSMNRSEVEIKVARAVEMVQLQGMEHRRPAELSGGQQQRVALARSLVFEPQLVLMDEPLGALDKNLREHMQYEIKRLHRQLGVTVVYVTHDQGEALTMSDRVAVFHQGRIAQLAEPATLYDRPATEYVAGFIGENNRLEAVLEALEGGHARARLKCGVLASCRAEGLGSANIGDTVQIMVRPEHVTPRLAADRDSDPAVKGRVVDIVYLGDHTRVIAQLPGGEELVMKANDPAVRSLYARESTVELGWRAETAVAFPVGG